MPVTFPAHQGLILPIKLRWPGAVDGTALCIGAASPDLAYPLGGWLAGQSHGVVGLVVWSLPMTLILTALVRWRAADGVFANVGDLGPLRLRSYRVLVRRRPPAIATAFSATIGAASHIVVDAFTHAGRWGATALGLNDVIGTVPFRGEMTGARVLQYVGHVGGSLLFVATVTTIASAGHLERWYGAEQVADARQAPSSRRRRLLFWSIVIVSTVAAAAFGRVTERSVLFLTVLAAAVSVVIAGTVVGRSAVVTRSSMAESDNSSSGQATRMQNGWPAGSA